MNKLNLKDDEEQNEETKLILEADDEKEIKSILLNENFTSNDNFKSKFNLEEELENK